jgi:hypothetical protein
MVWSSIVAAGMSILFAAMLLLQNRHHCLVTDQNNGMGLKKILQPNMSQVLSDHTLDLLHDLKKTFFAMSSSCSFGLHAAQTLAFCRFR